MPGEGGWHLAVALVAATMQRLLPAPHCSHADHFTWPLLCSPAGTFADPAKTEHVFKADVGAAGEDDWYAKGCSLCPSGQYRSGDASPENNECKNIPGGAPTDLWI